MVPSLAIQAYLPTIKQLRCVRPYVDFTTLKTASRPTTVTLELGYCNSLQAQNNLGHYILKTKPKLYSSHCLFKSPRFLHITPVLKSTVQHQLKECIADISRRAIWRRPFHPKFALKVTHVPNFDKRRLRQIFAYNVFNASTVRASEKSSINTSRKSNTAFPANYR